jgi:hypothetical protein
VFLQRAPCFVVPLHCLDEQLVVVGGLVVVVGGLVVVVGGLVVVVGGIDVHLVTPEFLLPISS